MIDLRILPEVLSATRQDLGPQELVVICELLRENRDKLSDSDAKTVEAAVADCKKALDDGNIDRINRAADALTQASHKVAESMYKTGAQGGSQAGGSALTAGSGRGGEKADDVIDAEYVDADDKKKD